MAKKTVTMQLKPAKKVPLTIGSSPQSGDMHNMMNGLAKPKRTKPVRLTQLQAHRVMTWIETNRKMIEETQCTYDWLVAECGIATKVKVTVTGFRGYLTELGVKRRTETQVTTGTVGLLTALLKDMAEVKKTVHEINAKLTE